MSVYLSHPGVPAFHQKAYAKRRPPRFDDFRAGILPVSLPVAAQAGPESALSYQDFIDGRFEMDTVQLRA